MASDFRLKEQLPQLTQRIVDTYQQYKWINHLGHCPLPRYDEVISAIEDLTEIIFPGYRRREGLHSGNVTYHVGDLIDGLHDKLTRQIARALRHEERVTSATAQDEASVRGSTAAEGAAVNMASDASDCGGNSRPLGDETIDFEAKGQAMAIAFLEKLPLVRATLATDVKAAFAGDPACKSPDEVVFCYPGLEAITTYRLAHELYQLGVPFIPRMMTEHAHRCTGIDIHPGATIGNHFFIDHGTGVVIGQTCEIGHHVKIYQGVTLGALSFATDSDGNLVRDTKRHPTIEDNVVIYANATILGGRTIVGHDSVIGSSVWLTHSVKPHTTVTMERPKLRIRAETPDDELNDPNYCI